MAEESGNKEVKEKPKQTWGVYEHPVQTELRILNVDGKVYTIEEALALILENQEKLIKGLLA